MAGAIASSASWDQFIKSLGDQETSVIFSRSLQLIALQMPARATDRAHPCKSPILGTPVKMALPLLMCAVGWWMLFPEHQLYFEFYSELSRQHCVYNNIIIIIMFSQDHVM